MMRVHQESPEDESLHSLHGIQTGSAVTWIERKVLHSVSMHGLLVWDAAVTAANQ